MALRRTQGILLDGTPVQAANGGNNFTGYTVVTRSSTQSQSYIPNLAGSESEKGVGVAVTKATSVTALLRTLRLIVSG